MKGLRILASIAACSTAVLAQNAAPVISIGVKEAPTPTGATVQTVVVGGFQPAATAGGQPTAQLSFTPETLTAQPGETVRFLFLGNNHSVVQSSLDAPCQPAANGFNTGFKPNMNNDLASAPTMDLQVPSTPGPLYMSTLSQTSCGVGMVLTVNPPPEGQPGSHTLFKVAAIRAGNPGLKNAAIVAAAPVAQVQSTVSINAAGAANAAQPTSAAGAAGPGTVVQGSGRTGNGQPCGCSCLCGAGAAAPPAGVAMGSFGGVVGAMPAPPAAAGAMSPANMAPMRMVKAMLDKHYKPPLH